MRRNRVAERLLLALLALANGCSSSGDDDDTGDDDVGDDEILDGVTFTERYSCNETFTSAPDVTCPDLNEEDRILFTATDDGYEVLDLPDTGFVLTGSFDGDDFDWTAISPDGYTEVGTWTFATDRTEFSGSSVYTADDATYHGDCNQTGVAGLLSPPDPTPPNGC